MFVGECAFCRVLVGGFRAFGCCFGLKSFGRMRQPLRERQWLQAARRFGQRQALPGESPRMRGHVSPVQQTYTLNPEPPFHVNTLKRPAPFFAKQGVVTILWKDSVLRLEGHEPNLVY